MRLVALIGLLLGVLIAGFAVTFLLARRRIMRRVRKDLAGETLLLAAWARVGEYDGAGARGGVAGILMLFGTGLYFRSWAGSREVFVAGPSISWIGVAEARERPDRHRIVVRFLNAAGKEDGIAVRLFSPEQWVDAIKTHLISRAQ